MTPKPKTEAESTVPQSLEGRVAALEAQRLEDSKTLAEIHAAVVTPADGKTLGLGEQVRNLAASVALIWAVIKWAAGVGTTAVIALVGAWLSGLRPPAPPH